MSNTLLPRLIAVLASEVAVIAALLMFLAGNWLWPSGWAFVALFGLLMFSVSFIFVRRDPDLIEERLASPMQKDQPASDKLWLGLYFLGFLGILVVGGLDERLGWSDVPMVLQILGALGLAASFWVLFVSMSYNSYLAPVVRLQSERGQVVVTTGPYAIVRHPFYAGIVPFGIFAALLLDSWWAVIPALAAVAGLAFRISQEERFLRTNLDGYDAYAAQVRYRLVPYVW